MELESTVIPIRDDVEMDTGRNVDRQEIDRALAQQQIDSRTAIRYSLQRVSCRTAIGEFSATIRMGRLLAGRFFCRALRRRSSF